jgi:hypothetical protein
MTAAADFANLHFTDATIQQVTLQGNRLLLRVKKIMVLEGDKPPELIPTCELVFEGVTFSRRVLIPYARSPKLKDTLPEETVTDVDGAHTGNLYELEGLLERPAAWIKEWSIHATSFSIATP